METEMTDIRNMALESGIKLASECMPKHIAIIMDGNGRWATSKGLPRPVGHYEGYKALREIVKACGDLEITALTVYAFSTENWTRSKEEVDALMNLFAQASRNELPLMMENNVQMRVIGRFHELPPEAQKSLGESIEATSGNTGLIFNLAINYGGRKEILDAVREACRQVQQGELTIDDITEQRFSDMLYTKGLPDPDMVIRTAGELRVSNYLLWQIAYAEIWVTSILWPDFTPADLIHAIGDFQKRERKFGMAPKTV